MKKKLKIEQLAIKSFVTSTSAIDPATIKGGKQYEVTERIVDGGCWASEIGGPPPIGPIGPSGPDCPTSPRNCGTGTRCLPPLDHRD